MDGWGWNLFGKGWYCEKLAVFYGCIDRGVLNAKEKVRKRCHGDEKVWYIIDEMS